MAKETFYEVLRVRKQTGANPEGLEELEEVVFTTPHYSEASVVRDKLNEELSPAERLMTEFRLAQRSLFGSEKDKRVN